MSREDVLRFYAATPVWFWPVLWWNLKCFRDWWAGLPSDQSRLARVQTDGRGRIRIRWVVAPCRPPQFDLSYTGPRQYELDDVELLSCLVERMARAGERVCTRTHEVAQCAPPGAAPLEPG